MEDLRNVLRAGKVPNGTVIKLEATTVRCLAGMSASFELQLSNAERVAFSTCKHAAGHEKRTFCGRSKR